MDLFDHTEGIGTELSGIKALAALILAASSRTHCTGQNQDADLSQADLEHIGLTMRDLIKRLEHKLNTVDRII